MSDDGEGARTLQDLLDREAIRDVLHRYCRAIDRCDEELLRSCYHEDAVEDHGGFFYGTRDEWVSSVIPSLVETMVATTHAVSNEQIDLEGDEAYVETYVLASHEYRDGGEMKWLGGRYIDRFVRRDGRWRILRRALMVDWTHAEPQRIAFGEGAAPEEATVGLRLRRGLQSREDPAYPAAARALLRQSSSVGG